MKSWLIAFGLTLAAAPALGATVNLGRGARLVSGGAYTSLRYGAIASRNSCGTGTGLGGHSRVVVTSTR